MASPHVTPLISSRTSMAAAATTVPMARGLHPAAAGLCGFPGSCRATWRPASPRPIGRRPSSARFVRHGPSSMPEMGMMMAVVVTVTPRTGVQRGGISMRSRRMRMGPCPPRTTRPSRWPFAPWHLDHLLLVVVVVMMMMMMTTIALQNHLMTPSRDVSSVTIWR